MTDAPSNPYFNVRTILEGLILAGTLWVVKGVADLNVQMASFNARLANMDRLQASVDALASRQTASEQGTASLNARVDNNAARISRIEGMR